jgi:hypothetical protein
MACYCSATQLNNYYVSGGVLVEKPAVQFIIDSAPAVDMGEDPLDAAPGTTMTFQISAAVPDATEVTFTRDGAEIALTDPVFTFTSGLSNVVTLTHPAQGLQGAIYGCSKDLKLTYIRLRGWA